MANYTRLAALMGTHQELALFRRFTNLNAKNLLYMQSELIHLEAQLDIIELENERSGDAEKAALLVSVYDLKESAGTRNDMQWQKAQEIREKLRCYNEALLLQAKVSRLERPAKRHMKVLKEWLDRPEGGDFFLRGREADIWEKEKDIIALGPQQAGKDCLTRWICDTLVPWYHRRWGHRLHKRPADEDWNGVWHYEEDSLIVVANIISTFLSSLLPTTSILVLYFVKAPLARLAVVMTFTSLFSLILAIVAKARRVDIFAATTAFAAVQVVFLGGTTFCNA